MSIRLLWPRFQRSRHMNGVIVVIVVGFSVAGSFNRARAGSLARGCLPDGTTHLRSVAVRFTGLAPAEGVARFYEQLRARGALPCRRLTLDESQPTLSHALMAPQHRAIPAPYVAAMDALICQLNPDGCTEGHPTANTLVVPDVHLTSHFPVWNNIPLDPEDAPEKDLEGVLARHGVSLPEQADSRSERIDSTAWLDTIRKANIGFTRALTKGVSSHGGARLKQRQLTVPLREYRTTIELPEALAKIPGKAFGIPDFSFDPVAPLAPSVRTNSTGTPGGPSTRFAEALRLISMPAKLPPAESETSSILLADRGIDSDCIFLHPDRDVPPDVLRTVGGSISPCATAKHGTHVWGIIGGLVPDILHGVALIERVAPDVQVWDFDKHAPDASPDFFDFVNGSVGSARVANFSFDFGRDLTPAQADRIAAMVEATPSILYVVAADDQPTTYKRGPLLTLPVKLNEDDNVVVVTALNEAGTGVWDRAARNASETEDVVLMAAPGIGIPSACGDTSMGVLDGTSQATAFVSGAAALLVRDGLDDSLRIKRRLAYSADILPDLVGGVAGGRLNVDRALGARHDKLCDFTGGDGVACAPWVPGVVQLGYKTSAGFIKARTVVLKRSSGQTMEVSPATRLLRIARMPTGNGSASSSDGFAVFYLEPDQSRQDRLRRKRVMALEAFSDKDHHGSLVIRLEQADGTLKDVDLETLGDFIRRGV